jgi:hypothetical protein
MTEEGAGQRTVPEHLGDQGELEHLEPGASVRLRHDQARHAHLGQALPECRIVPRARVEDLAQPGRRALAVDEARNRLLEQLLLLAQSEMHGGDN